MTTAALCTGICAIPAYAESDPVTLSRTYTAEEFYDAFISENEDFSDGGVIYPKGGKVAVQMHDSSDLSATVIIYGFETPDDIKYAKIDLGDYGYTETPDGYYSGMYGFLYALNDTELLDKQQKVKIVYFSNNVITDFQRRPLDLLETYEYYGFDIAPYVYTSLTPGDADCDGAITASDASLVLSAYAVLSTGHNIELNQTIFDYNNDGLIDSSDASAILVEYAEVSTM